MAAQLRNDGGRGLALLLRAAGFEETPEMRIIVRKPPRERKRERSPRRHSPDPDAPDPSWVPIWD